MPSKYALPAWVLAIAGVCLALYLFGVGWRVAAGVFVAIAALRLAGHASAASRRGEQ